MQLNSVRQLKLKAGRQPALHLPAVLCLCCAAFLAGRWLTRSSSYPAAPVSNKDQEDWSQLLLQQSGLLRDRPPLQPAASGNAQYTLVPYQILSWYPRIVLFPNFIDDARAAAIIKLARNQLKPSTVRVKGAADRNVRAAGRSSNGAALSQADDPTGVLSWLERKIQDATLLPASHGENFYVINYKEGEEYSTHLDPHDESEYGPQKSKRVATVVVYLNDVGSNGETLFPKEGHDGLDRPVGPAACEDNLGFKYKPRKGDALLFYSQNPDLTLEPRSAHAGCPVGKGSEKWVVTKWIHDKPIVAQGFGWD